MTRDEIAAEVESLALHASAAGLARTEGLLHYIAKVIERGAEGHISAVIVEATTKAIVDLGRGKAVEGDED